MARSTYLGTAADMLLVKRGGTLGVSTKAGVLRFWDAETGGTRHTDLLLDGDPVTEVPIPAGTVLAPAVQLPDGVNGGAWVEYVLDGATTADTREFVLPRFTPADVPTPTPEAIGAETPAGAQSKADAAQTAAETTAQALVDALKGAAPAAYDTLVEIATKLDADDDVTATILADLADKVDGADLDTLVAAEVDTPASATATALSATFAAKAHETNTANPHAVTKAQVGLGNVDNTADADKPVSTATQAALDGKAGLAATKNVFTGKSEHNGGFANSLDTTVWVAPPNRVNPTVASQSVYAQHRVSGDLGGVVHDAMAAEIRVSGASNAPFVNAFEATAEVTGGANTISDMRAITANFLFAGAPTGTITAASVIRAQAIPAGTGPAITTAYGLYVENQTAGTTNWSIYAPTGKSKLGDVEGDRLSVSGLFGTGVALVNCSLLVRNAANTGTHFSIGTAGPRWNDAGLQQTTVGAAGGASALPATPTKYLKVQDSAGTTLVIPAYAA